MRKAHPRRTRIRVTSVTLDLAARATAADELPVIVELNVSPRALRAHALKDIRTASEARGPRQLPGFRNSARTPSQSASVRARALRLRF